MVTVPDRDDWFKTVHGLPQPLWGAVHGWMRAFISTETLHEAWQQFVRHWLERIRVQMPGAYTVAESEHFHFLSDAAETEQVSFIAFLEHARKHIRRVLGDIGTPDGPGKHVVVRFSDLDIYCRYLAHFSPDGEQAMSGGVFLNRGYLHIVFPSGNGPDVNRSVCVHELTHNLLAHLPLPPWLNEALAMAFESDLAGGEEPLTHELVGRHRSYWNADTIQIFWQGAAFHDVDGQEVAYSLARILLRTIHEQIRPSPVDFRKFVLRAEDGDAGAVAAREHLGEELEVLAASFLGPGDWAPKPETWDAFAKGQQGTAADADADHDALAECEG